MAAKKVIKINSNPNKTKIATSSPTSDAVRQWSNENRTREKYYNLEKGSTKSIYKINSNPKPGKTTVSPMANVRGRIVGGGLGGMFGTKNR